MTRFRRHLAATAGALGVAAIVAGTATAATVTNIDTGDPQGQPLGIVAGPGGSMFFADAGANSLSQITPGGAVVPNGYVGAQAPAQVALGPDGNVWTTEGGTTAARAGQPRHAGHARRERGAVQRARLEPPGHHGRPRRQALVREPGRRRPLQRDHRGHGQRGRFPTAQGGPPPATQGTGPKGITRGPAGDPNVYIATETGVSAANTGAPAPSQIALVNNAMSITTGPDGNLWVGTAGGVEHLGRNGSFLGGGVGVPGGNVRAITVGPDGALWFAESGRDAVGRLTTGGDYSEIPTPGCDNPSGIATGGDGAIYATCFGAEITPGGNTTGHTIVKITPDAAGGGGGGGVVPAPKAPAAKINGTFTLKRPVFAGKKFTVSVKFNKRCPRARSRSSTRARRRRARSRSTRPSAARS